MRSSTAAACVVFDGDDTLWETEPLYDRARSEAAALVAEAGLDPAQFDGLQRQIDVEQVKELGLSSNRFPSSSALAVRELAKRTNQHAEDRLVEAV